MCHLTSSSLFSPRLLVLLALLAAFFQAGPSGAAVLTVGSSENCQFKFLDVAIRASAHGDEIHIEKGTYTESDDGVFTSGGFTISDQNLKLVGGFDKCDGQRVGTSTLTTGGLQRIMTISADKERRFVWLEHLVITGGGIQSPYTQPWAGGILATGAIDLNLIDVRVENHEGIYGGGVTLLGTVDELARLSLTDSAITKNLALEDGGGVYCQRGLVALYRSALDTNTAEGHGGGAFFDDCSAYTPESPVSISWNSADGDGGGFFAKNASRILLRQALGAVGEIQIAHNEAQRGGGAAIEDASLLSVVRTNFHDNFAFDSGGAIAARSASEVRVGEDLDACNKPNGCQRFDDNIAWVSGGALQLDQALAVLVAVRGHGNAAGFGPGAFINAGAGSVIRMWSNALDQHAGETLVSAKSPAALDVRSSTFFDNFIEDSVFDVSNPDSAVISQSIFHDNGADFVAGNGAGNGVGFTCNLVDLDPQFALPAGEIQTLRADPFFVAAGDYHLSAFSPAIGLCGVDTLHAPQDLELDDRPGPKYDAGADER